MTSTDTLTCPRCQIPLKQTKMSQGIFWGCGNCGGRAVTVELLRRTFTPESINPLWLHAIRGEGQSSAGCPLCKRPMIEVALSEQAKVKVDVCKLCHFVWFDAHEVESLTAKPVEEILQEKQEHKDRERIAAEKMKHFAEQVDQYQLTTTSRSELWRAMASVFLR